MFNRSISGLWSNFGRSEIINVGESEATQTAREAQERRRNDKSEVIRVSKKKSGYAKYSFAFASDIQSLADEKHVKVAHFNVQSCRNDLGSYDYLTVNFIVPRPDRDAQDQSKLNDHGTNDPGKDKEVISHEI